ncbi:DnaJ-domain-containing protein [Crucibulum laeve]|uniref:DnaJ-domain-containing protein n=1 Tax=Crucibulum laeve TaxID=68775 RepID=A0A5C3LQ89_9AGAR|nr:DnaJ-domain-containing protein [Crucibulum laeve]
MATYEYDEAGVMAAYFVITFLALILVPLTLSISPQKKAKTMDGCQCKPCVEQRQRSSKRERGSIFNPKLSKKTYVLVAGWSLLAFISYKVSNTKLDTKLYDPFEILGIKADTPEKEIKSHFKKLSRMYHPDKVKASVNETIESIQDRFVKITKAYKSLTDETIRENWIKYNNPDGPQRMSMGIALPKWIIEGQNNIWVLGVYGLLFGIALPALVGRWWFGSREKTKDGVHAKTAAAFFKSLKEEATMEEVVGALSKGYQWELDTTTKSKGEAELDELEKEIAEQAGAKWTQVRKFAKDKDVVGELDAKRRKALVLLYAHLLRIDVNDTGLQKDQTQILLQTPVLLNALLNASISRNWLLPTLAVMRLHAFIAQALPPSTGDRLRFAQLPGINAKDVDTFGSTAKDVSDFVDTLESKKDDRVVEVKKAVQKWGRIELVDAAFKVIGERIIVPSSIIYLVVKLRISPPGTKTEKELSVDETKRVIKANDEKDDKFLLAKGDTEELPGDVTSGWAHAPYWPGERKPSWWVVLADDKSGRVVVPPFKITDVPYSQPGSDRDYRSYKIQFQGPPSTGLFTWKIYIVSDTFVGEEPTTEITLKIEDPPANEEPSEDEISDPDEDTLAGQMAAMRGGPVKKHKDGEDSDEESGTDDDQDSDDSSSDSDSD